jgi:glycosyltransferase involved in cell wall biosynthesis
MRPLRVTVVAGHAVLGGAEGWLLRLLDATERFEVDAVALQDGPLVGELRARGIEVVVRPVGVQPWSLAGPVAWLAGALRRSSADVVLANGVKAALVAVPAARLAGVPVVWAKHDHMYDSLVARPLARLADGVVGAVQELVEPCGPMRNVVVVPPPRADSPPASREEARRFWGFEHERSPVLGMVGRLVPYKGVDDALRALTRVDGWRLAVVGDDDPAAVGEQARLEALAASLGVADRVVFKGAVPGASHWLAGFDALAVLTKPTGDARAPTKEGFGTSAFEAMVAGVPVIGVEGGAVVRRLDGGRAGVGVPAGSPEAVAAALASMSDPEVRSAMGAAARQLVADHPDAASCASTLAGFLAAVAHRPGAGLHDGPPVSVITTVKDEGAGIDRLLSCLVPQLDGDDEVIVVDGGSSDDTVARAGAWGGRVRVIVAPGAGISEGRNRAVEAARHEVVAATDAGCDPDGGWLHALRVAAADRPAPELVTGLYDVAARNPMEEAFAHACYPDVREARRAGVWTRLYFALLGRAFDPSLPTGRSMAFTKGGWRQAGGFPEDLATAEDVTFGQSIVAAGGRAVLASDAVVTWEQRPGLRATGRMYRNYGVGDGLSRHPLLIGRNLARMAAYVVGPLLWRRGGRGRGRALAAAGAAVYLSVPVMRARRRRAGVRAWLLLPVALAVKDLTKAWGCICGLVGRRGS